MTLPSTCSAGPAPRRRALASPALVLVALAACSPSGPADSPEGTAPSAPGVGRSERALIDRVLGEAMENVDPSLSGWNTEVQNDLVGGHLKHLGHVWARPQVGADGLAGASAREELGAFCGESFRTAGLRVKAPELRYEDRGLVVRSGDRAGGGSYSGLGGLVAALEDLRAPYAPEEELHVKFKIVDVKDEKDALHIEALFRADGGAEEGVCQQSSLWKLDWDTSDRDHLELLSVEVVDYVENHSPRGPFFEDCTLAVFDNEPSRAMWEEHLGVHVEDWLGSVQSSVLSSLLGHQGLAVGDVDGDGLEDVYVCQAGGLPNRLLRQQEDGTVVDIAPGAGVDFLDPSRGVLILDLDNDGDQDIAMATASLVLVLENDGRARFERRAHLPFAQIHSLAAADYDGDGDLDLYGCAYKIPDGTGSTPIPYHDANNGEPNVLLRNDIAGKEWSFRDVTVEVGMDENNRRFSFAGSWEDYDNDGDLDLYVANDFGRNNLYRNEGGRFRDVAAEAGVEDISAGMGVSWGDVDNDGWMDIHVSNMFSSAGNRIAYQRNFKEELDDSTLSHFRRHARGNSLFSNAGDGTFRDVSLDAGITMGRWAWASKVCDLNNDARQDILVGNGLVTNAEPRDL